MADMSLFKRKIAKQTVTNPYLEAVKNVDISRFLVPREPVALPAPEPELPIVELAEVELVPEVHPIEKLIADALEELSQDDIETKEYPAEWVIGGEVPSMLDAMSDEEEDALAYELTEIA